jgi:hypothetical protein
MAAATTATLADSLKAQYTKYCTKRDALLTEAARKLWDVVRAQPMEQWVITRHTGQVEKHLFSTAPPPTVTMKLRYEQDWSNEYYAVLKECRYVDGEQDVHRELMTVLLDMLDTHIKDERFKTTFNVWAGKRNSDGTEEKRRIVISVHFTVDQHANAADKHWSNY